MLAEIAICYSSNPHPARKPGATFRSVQQFLSKVPILTQPESRVLHTKYKDGDFIYWVPILTQPES